MRLSLSLGYVAILYFLLPSYVPRTHKDTQSRMECWSAESVLCVCVYIKFIFMKQLCWLAGLLAFFSKR